RGHGSGPCHLARDTRTQQAIARAIWLFHRACGAGGLWAVLLSPFSRATPRFRAHAHDPLTHFYCLGSGDMLGYSRWHPHRGQPLLVRGSPGDTARPLRTINARFLDRYYAHAAVCRGLELAPGFWLGDLGVHGAASDHAGDVSSPAVPAHLAFGHAGGPGAGLRTYGTCERSQGASGDYQTCPEERGYSHRHRGWLAVRRPARWCGGH